ncbi:hypothetical protein CDL15_Pgr024950 [Punica granatum]|uniref:Uncharacterized protein n=1 Tax=Punica granatum TaxID=22663 RepID=A0A218W888_PUNGR|nr:hypothetical protein CDL15_Pgr024950 [Punica granatum]
MASRVSNFSNLIQRVSASCLLDPLCAVRRDPDYANGKYYEDDEERDLEHFEEGQDTEEEEEEREATQQEENNGGVRTLEQSKRESRMEGLAVEMEVLLNEVFDAVSMMKRAYVGLQEAHCPWDPEKMRAADVTVVAELKRLGVLRERYRRSILVNGGGVSGRRSIDGRAVGLREVVAPYEAAVDELKREVKAREVEVENLREKLRSVTNLGGNTKKGRSLSKKKLTLSPSQVIAAPAPELFEATMSRVKEASKSFTAILLSLMRSAHWDISAAIRSIQATSAAGGTKNTSSKTGTHHVKYSLESYISHKIFQGFDHETFYMDGSLSSLLNPEQYHQECFTQYRDMKSMDPVELLGILPTCQFGQFCLKKYLLIVNPKMEGSLFGNLDQQNQVIHGNHPRSEFYREFLGLAKAVWSLHLLAFSLDPSPNQFEASRGAEFHPQYMESVVKFSDGRVPAGHIVGFPVSPGFKLGNGSVIRARVYLVSRM